MSEFEPAGDQPQAIAELLKAAISAGRAGGSGKTFTMAHVIAPMQRPAIVLAPNKILAAQLYGEFKSFFPNNAVEYFVSYYDYYQPEAYVPRTDTYIEKDSSINEQIDRMRHSATRALFERDDVIIVASVSCIYGIGSPETYARMTPSADGAEGRARGGCCRRWSSCSTAATSSTSAAARSGAKGDMVEIFPAYLEDRAWRPLDVRRRGRGHHRVRPADRREDGAARQVRALPEQPLRDAQADAAGRDRGHQGRAEGAARGVPLTGKLLEAERLEQRTMADIEMMLTTGSCPGIENYSRYLTGRAPGEPPPTLFEYIPETSSCSSTRATSRCRRSAACTRATFQRKSTLVEFGFRLPSCMDNRPLKFEEWDVMRPQTVFVSADAAATGSWSGPAACSSSR